MNAPKKNMFVTPDGQNLTVTFFLVASLFMLWGLCNGMIDQMDKHFQDQLNLTKAQSAWVQFAHYMGYAIMALPAGLLTRRTGYKYGIITGLAIVAVGGMWFVPATAISQFWAFLMGVCLIAMGLTILETVANPYATVLGPKEYGPTRINLAQSFNGIGWILGPLVAARFFYSEGGVEKAHGQLYIPYAGVAVVVLVLALLFWRARVPDIQVEDDYHTDEKGPGIPVARERNRPMILLMVFLNVVAVGVSVYLILHTILPSVMEKASFEKADKWVPYAIVGLVLCALPGLMAFAKRATSHSIWAHTHFSGATLAQFLYVAAQAGIFSYFINTMTVDKTNGYCLVPALPASWSTGTLKDWGWVETRVAITETDITSMDALVGKLKAKADPVSSFLAGQLTEETAKLLAAAPAGPTSPDLKKALLKELNEILRQELNKKNGKPALYDAQRFAGVTLAEATQKAVEANPSADNARLTLNRRLLADAYSGTMAFDDSKLGISDMGAGSLASIAFALFTLGRFIGSALLRKFAAHKVLGTFALTNVAVCGLIIAKLSWLSVAAVFASYFFMSIMFPTIFALGIFGFGSQSKKNASAFIVMAITGGAVMTKTMGWLGDTFNMAVAFWMPLACFILIALYAFSWCSLSGSEPVVGAKAGSSH